MDIRKFSSNICPLRMLRKDFFRISKPTIKYAMTNRAIFPAGGSGRGQGGRCKPAAEVQYFMQQAGGAFYSFSVLYFAVRFYFGNDFAGLGQNLFKVGFFCFQCQLLSHEADRSFDNAGNFSDCIFNFGGAVGCSPSQSVGRFFSYLPRFID